MKGETILKAYAKACDDTLSAKDWRQRDAFEADLLARLRVSDTLRRLYETRQKGPKDAEQIITGLFGSVQDTDGFFRGLVARIRGDEMIIETQKVEIAALKAQSEAQKAELASVTQQYLDLLEERNTLKTEIAVLKAQLKSAWQLDAP